MKKLTIVGRGNSIFDCPFDTQETWGALTCLITEGMDEFTYNKLFAFDPIDDPLIKQAVSEAKAKGIPIVSTREYADEKYPFVEIIKMFHTNYFRPTVSFMIAMALYEGYEHLSIYGIDQGPSHNYLVQRPYVASWVLIANVLLEGKVKLPTDSWIYLRGSDRQVRELIGDESKGIHNGQVPTPVR